MKTLISLLLSYLVVATSASAGKESTFSTLFLLSAHYNSNAEIFNAGKNSFLDSAVGCARTYQGGCGNWDDKSLGVNYQNRAYTVKECHDLCKAQSDCGGFFLGTSTNHCLLARSGCTDDDNSNWNYYDMSTCSYSTGTSYF